MKQNNRKPVVRVVRLDETSWKWLCDWLTELLKEISLEEMTRDTLRASSILADLIAAKREYDEQNGGTGVQAPVREGK